jgi:hypothetical protein
MINYQGTALVTGASSGIGETFARVLAARGMDVVLTARSLDRLEALAAELRTRCGVEAHVIAADLAQPDGAQQLFDATEARGLRINLLVNNAGFATHGPFQSLNLRREQEEITLNVHALVTLTHLYLPQLLMKPGAGIVNVASTAAFQPLPYMAVYGASKAFVLSFSEALWAQFKGSNVSVLAFCPGPVKTRFSEVVGAPEAMVGKQDTPEFVVARALDALERNRSYVIPRFSQTLLASLGRFLPRSVVAKISHDVLQPRTPANPPKPAV